MDDPLQKIRLELRSSVEHLEKQLKKSKPLSLSDLKACSLARNHLDAYLQGNTLHKEAKYLLGHAMHLKYSIIKGDKSLILKDIQAIKQLCGPKK